MFKWNKTVVPIILVSSLFILPTLSCSLLSNLGIAPTEATPTPTEFAGGAIITPENPAQPCKGLSGTIEMQLLVGPAEAVGLTPYTFADIPFQVIQEGNSYLVEGSGLIGYYEDVLTADWGSFSVTFDGVTSVTGDCQAAAGAGTLNVTVEMTGQQTVVVIVEGMEYTYPWEGSPTVSASFPLVDGAQVGGEGWTLTLHLN